jgi:hypothetical protein
MQNNSSKFEVFLNTILLIINCLLLIAGLILCLSIIIFKYTKLIDSDKFNNDFQTIKNLIDMALIDEFAAGIFGFSVFFIIVGFVGLYGTVKGKDGKPYLIIYLVIFVILFLTHVVCFILFGFLSANVESTFVQKMNNTIDNINTKTENTKLFQDSCVLMKAASNLFECCETQIVTKKSCCVGTYKTSCASNILNFLKSYTHVLLVSIFFIVIFEYLITLIITFLIGSISFQIRDFRLRRQFSEARNSINL